MKQKVYILAALLVVLATTVLAWPNTGVGTPVTEPKYSVHWLPSHKECIYRQADGVRYFLNITGYLKNNSYGVETCYPFVSRGGHRAKATSHATTGFLQGNMSTPTNTSNTTSNTTAHGNNTNTTRPCPTSSGGTYQTGISRNQTSCGPAMRPTQPPTLTLLGNGTLTIKAPYPKINGTKEFVLICNAPLNGSSTRYTWYYGDGAKSIEIKNGNTFHRYPLNQTFVVNCTALNSTHYSTASLVLHT